MARRLTVLFALFASCAVSAQSADPTRPAIDAGTSVPGMAAASSSVALQSIIQRGNGKPAALINGKVVELGGKVGDARLVKIGDDFVVLRGAQGKETLRLTPDVERKVVRKETK